MRLVDTNILTTLIQQAPQQAPPPQQQPQYPAGYPPYGAPPPVPQGFPPGYAPTPPVQQQTYQPPPQAAPQGQDPAQLMQTVLALTREQIMGLDEGSRNQILALRGQLGAPVT